MAPVNGATSKPAKTAARRTIPKTVVPVLPLNYPQRPAPKQPTAPPKPSPLAEAQPNRIAEGQEDKQEDKQAADHQPQHSHHVGLLVEDENMPPSAAPVENGHTVATPSTIPAQPTVIAAEVSVPPVSSATQSTGTPTTIAAPPGHTVASPTPTRPPGPTIPPSNSPTLYGSTHEHPIQASQPAFVYRPTFHQAHPSNGSLIFGAFHGSNTSSPAPHSGGGFPPPSMMAYPPVYGRPLMVSSVVDGYGPPVPMNHHGPPTPHSFQGSQSSVQADDHSIGHYPVVNGHNGYPIEQAAGVQPTMHISGMNPRNGSMHGNFLQEQDDVAFLRSGVDDTTYHDCVLEMHFPDGPLFQDHPDYPRLHPVVRMPAHRFVLSRSRALSEIMKSQHVAPGGVVMLDLRGEYMRSDVFCFALRTLYGWSFGDGVPPTELRLRDFKDDFKLALSYVTVGQYLQLEWIYAPAIQRASGLLYWETLQLAINFVLPSTVLPRSNGFNGTELLSNILGFIVKNFPKDFVLDTNVSDQGFSRLPAVSSPVHAAPSIAHGSANGVHSRSPSQSQAHMPRSQRLSANPRLSQIKFGDLSPPVRNGYSPTPETGATQHRPAPSANETILSRILLNLPYELLKQVLEDPNLAGSPTELGQLARHAIVTEIIAEREARRLRTLDKSQTQLHMFQAALSRARTPLVVGQIGDFLVNNMGFKEEVCEGDVPFLVHNWSGPSSVSP